MKASKLSPAFSHPLLLALLTMLLHNHLRSLLPSKADLFLTILFVHASSFQHSVCVFIHPQPQLSIGHGVLSVASPPTCSHLAVACISRAALHQHSLIIRPCAVLSLALTAVEQDGVGRSIRGLTAARSRQPALSPTTIAIPQSCTATLQSSSLRLSTCAVVRISRHPSGGAWYQCTQQCQRYQRHQLAVAPPKSLRPPLRLIGHVLIRLILLLVIIVSIITFVRLRG